LKENLIETESSACWIEEGVVYFVFKTNKVDLAEAKEAIETTIAITNNLPYPFYFDISRIKSLSKDARQYLSIPRSTENNIATAALAPNVIAKLIGTFFMAFSNPGVKIKLFTQEEEAIKWLKEMNAKWER
jgi:hypothetical protein